MNFRAVIFSSFLLIFVLFASCGGDKKDIVAPVIPQPTSISLKAEEVGDSLVINWSVDKGAFEYFELMINWQPELYPLQEMKVLLDGHVKRHAMLKFGEIPLKSYVVTGYLKGGSSVNSNKIETYRPELMPVNLTAFDAVFIEDKKMAYFFDQRGLAIGYNFDSLKPFAGAIVGGGVGIGYSGYGTYNNITELYVPSGDGHLYIYNAADLALIDKIYIGTAAVSVVSANGSLFVSTNDFYGTPIKVYSRAQKTLQAVGGLSGSTRLVLLAGGAGIMDVSSPLNTIQQATSYELNAQGQLVIKKEQPYTYQGWSINGHLAYVYPDGSRTVISNSGMLLNQQLGLERRLTSLPNVYISYCYNALTAQLYAADAVNQRVDVYTGDGATKIKTITTTLYPRWLFNVKGKIFMMGSKTRAGSWWAHPNKLYVEQLEK